MGDRYVVRQKIAPGLAAGIEFEVIHEDENKKHVIVATYETVTALVDGQLKKRTVPTHHRITAGGLKKADAVTEASGT